MPSRVPLALAKAMTENTTVSFIKHTDSGILSRYQLDWVDGSLMEHEVVRGAWTEQIHFWILSYRLLALVTAILPSLWFVRRCLPARHKCAGHCPICNYDLRATPDRCPECGAIPDKVKA